MTLAGCSTGTFVDPGRLTHILDALQYVFGDLEAPDEPRK